MSLDLKYKNKEGISLQKVLNTVKKSDKLSKKDIAEKVKASRSIDTLLNKLVASGLLVKNKAGNKVLFSMNKTEESISEPEDIETKPTTNKRVTKAKPKTDKTPEEIEEINNQITNVIKDYNIERLVEMEEEQSPHFPTIEINQNDLDTLKEQLEGKLGKDVTAILHKRNESSTKKKKKDAGTIYEEHKQELEDVEELEMDNSYRFVLNFFTSILNKEFSTPYFRRRDAYVVKSIYNKFKTLCDPVEDYNPDMQHMPFYRVITVNETDMTVKIYHIDVNRVVRGIHTIFKLNPLDKDLIFESLKRKGI